MDFMHSYGRVHWNIMIAMDPSSFFWRCAILHKRNLDKSWKNMFFQCKIFIIAKNCHFSEIKKLEKKKKQCDGLYWTYMNKY